MVLSTFAKSNSLDMYYCVCGIFHQTRILWKYKYTSILCCACTQKNSIIFSGELNVEISLWNGVFTLNIGPVPTFSSSGHFGIKMSKNQCVFTCEAPAHTMDHQSASQDYKKINGVCLCLWFIFILLFEVVCE